jgi:hypothetical protein
MKTTIGWGDFTKAFDSMRPDNFTYDGLSALYDYLVQYEDETGEEIELDVIAICCDFSEDRWETIANYYDVTLDEAADDEENADRVRQFLEDEGAFIGEGSDGSFVYREF